MNARRIKMIVKALVLTMGVSFLIAGIVVYAKGRKYQADGIKTSAYIESIDVKMTNHKDNRGKYKEEHTVYVSYEADGQNYYGELNAYTSNMHEGDRVSIYYMPDDPTDFVYVGSLNVMGIVFAIIGLVSIVVYIILVIVLREKK